MNQGIVKCVLSGDTIIIRGRPVNGPPPEKLMGISGISAPKMLKNEQEPYAFLAREALRKLLVGKTVQFQIEYTNQTGKDYATVTLSKEDGSVVDVATEMVESGWAKARSDEGSLKLSEDKARVEGNGMWNSQINGNCEINSNKVSDPAMYVKEHKGVERRALIEQVKDGSTLRVLFYDDLQIVNCIMAGIKAPTYRKDIPGIDDLIEPFAEEAKFFTETRLLQREVQITILGHENQNFVVSVKHPAGNIAEILLANGYARIVPWGISYIGKDIQTLRAAEEIAKSKRLRIWKDFTVPVKKTGNEFHGIVVRILSGDSLLVESENGLTQRITLSSVKQPNPNEQSFLNFEAREFLRKKLIGKKIHVQIDYTTPAQNSLPERICATCMLGKTDIGEALVSKGLATVVRYKKDDMNRARNFDALMLAQAEAQEQKRGVFSDKDVKQQMRITDASENAAKARSFLPFFKRAGRVNAIIEHVISGSKFRIYVPKDSCKLAFSLSGIRCPRTDKNEPFSKESFEFAEKNCLQRDVEIEIEGIDKNGGFIGTLWLNKTLNYSVEVLRQGLAYIYSSASADQSSYVNELYIAENDAKAHNRMIWSDKSLFEFDQTEDETNVYVSNEIRDVIITEIIDAQTVYAQFCGPELQRLDELMSDLEFKLKSEIRGETNVFSHKPKVGDLVAAKFSEDNQWYRGKVKRVNDSKSYEIFYIDYGNTEIVNVELLRRLDAQFVKLPAQAHHLKLAFVKTPGIETDYGREAADYLKELVNKPKMKAKTIFKTGSQYNVTLYDPDEVVEINANLINLSVNGKLLRNGYAQVQIPQAYKGDEVAVLQKEERFARMNRLGMFEYGDYDFNDPGI